jgi:hypothetical protein
MARDMRPVITNAPCLCNSCAVDVSCQVCIHTGTGLLMNPSLSHTHKFDDRVLESRATVYGRRTR